MSKNTLRGCSSSAVQIINMLNEWGCTILPSAPLKLYYDNNDSSNNTTNNTTTYNKTNNVNTNNSNNNTNNFNNL